MANTLLFAAVDSFEDDLRKATSNNITRNTTSKQLEISSGQTSGTWQSINQIPPNNATLEELQYSCTLPLGDDNAWIQTTLAQFNAGVKINVSTLNVVDSVVLPTGEFSSDANVWAGYHLNEGAGDSANDFGPNNRDGTKGSAAAWTTDKKLGAYGMEFPLGQLQAFVNMGTDVIPAPNFTIEFWVKKLGAAANREMMWKGASFGISFGNLGAGGTDGKYVFSVYDGSWATMSSLTSWDNAWHYLTITYNGTTAKIYIDGILDKTETLSKTPNANSEILYFGAHPGNAPADAIVDELRFSNSIRYTGDFMPPDTYPSAGTIASQVWDSGVVSQTYPQILWNGTFSSVKKMTRIRVRANNNIFDKNDAWISYWEYGTAGGANIGGDSPQTISGVTGRYVQWEIRLETTDPALTPQLDDVTLQTPNATPSTILFSLSQNGTSWSSNYSASAGTNIINLTSLGYSAAAYWKATLGRVTSTSSTPTLTEVRLRYALNDTLPTAAVHIWDKDNVERTFASGALEVVGLELNLNDKEQVDDFTITLDNSDGKYSNYFSVGRDVKIYLGYNGANTQKVIGIVDDVDFEAVRYARDVCTIRGRSYEAKLEWRRLTDAAHREYAGLAAGEIVKDLMDTYLPSASSGITISNVQSGTTTIDQSQMTGGTSRNVFTYPVTEIKDQYQEGISGNGYVMYGVNWILQSFIPKVATINKFEVYIRKADTTTQDIILGLRASTTGADIVTIAVPAASISTSFSWITFDIANTSVTPGNTYYIVIRSPTGDSSTSWYSWQSHEIPDGYPSGGYAFSNTSGSSWGGIGSYDMTFRAYGQGGWTYGQTFTTGAGVTNISRISLYLAKYAYTGTGNFTLTLYTSTAKTTTIGSTTKAAADITASVAWVDFNFNPKPIVTAATSYYYELTAPTDCTYELRALAYFDDNNNLYANGSMYTVADGTPTIATNDDAAFKTYYMTTTISNIAFSENDTVLDAIRKVSDIFDWNFYIDLAKDLHFAPNDTLAQPFGFESGYNILAARITKASGFRLKNWIKVRGADTEVTVTGESETGDGSTRVWTLDACTLQLEKTTGDYETLDTTTKYVAQSFKVGSEAILISEVTIWAKDTGVTTGNGLTLEIWNLDSQSPTADPNSASKVSGATATITQNATDTNISTATNGNKLTFKFSSPVSLTANTYYGIVVFPSAIGAGAFRVYGTDNNKYTNGEAQWSTDTGALFASGGVNIASGGDLYFDLNIFVEIKRPITVTNAAAATREDVDYWINYETGQISFAAAPTNLNALLFSYNWLKKVYDIDQDSTSQTDYGRRDYFEQDETLTTVNQCSDWAAARKSEYKDPELLGTINTIGLPDLVINSLAWVTYTNAGIDGQYTIASIRYIFSQMNFSCVITLNKKEKTRWEYIKAINDRLKSLEAGNL